MAKKGQKASWESRHYISLPKNDIEPVPEIQRQHKKNKDIQKSRSESEY